MDEKLEQQQVITDDLRDRFLTFYIGDSTYGMELCHVTEIIQIQSITMIPNVAHYIKGIINLRGKIVPVIDVRLKFGYEEAPYQESTCIVVVVTGDSQVGLIVDMVSEVVPIPPENRTTPPQSSTASGSAQYLANIAQMGDRVILNIDCDKFFASDLSPVGIYQG